MNWGTRGKNTNWLNNYWSFILWTGTMLGGFVYTIYKNYSFEISNERYFIAFVGWMFFIGLVSITIIIEFILRKLNKLTNEVENDIINERKSIDV